jgi:metal iron transporter
VLSAAGTVFALSLLLSGVSAGIVCTISGQMVSEGALRWKVRLWLRRLVTRSISITPSIVIAAAVGRTGLNDALNASQVVLSIVLPFVSALLIYFTCCAKYMVVNPGNIHTASAVATNEIGQSQPQEAESTSMANSWYTTAFAVLVWLMISVLNVANLVLLGLGK